MSENGPKIGVGKRTEFHRFLSPAKVCVDAGPFSDTNFWSVFRPQFLVRFLNRGATIGDVSAAELASMFGPLSDQTFSSFFRTARLSLATSALLGRMAKNCVGPRAKNKFLSHNPSRRQTSKELISRNVHPVWRHQRSKLHKSNSGSQGTRSYAYAAPCGVAVATLIARAYLLQNKEVFREVSTEGVNRTDATAYQRR